LCGVYAYNLFCFLATCKELVVFTKFFDKVVNILPVQNVASQLISAKIITVDDDEEIKSIVRSKEKATFVLRKVAHSLEVGITQSFYTLLTIMEQHGSDAAVVATAIREEMKKFAGTPTHTYTHTYAHTYTQTYIRKTVRLTVWL